MGQKAPSQGLAGTQIQVTCTQKEGGSPIGIS